MIEEKGIEGLNKLQARIREFDLNSPAGKIVLTVLCYIVFALLFFPFYIYVGVSIGIFIALPIMTGAWLVGLWGGLIATLLSFPFILFLFFLVGERDLSILLQQGQVAVLAMMLIILLVAIIIGHMRDLDTILRKELFQRKHAEDNLAVQAEELARSNTDLEQFAYVASHDLQEPLRAVVSYLQLLEKKYKGKLDSDADEFIGFAVDGARRMRGLIKGLFAYSRISTKGKPAELTDSSEILEGVLEALKLPISENNAVITHDPLPQVKVDATQISQLFQNLISNAMKFSADFLPEIHISAKHKEGEWLFSVKDNGIGIAPEHVERIFLIFKRLHTESEYSGTGIGLAICKRIVERHGGRIWVESEPQKGATFYFTISNVGGES